MRKFVKYMKYIIIFFIVLIIFLYCIRVYIFSPIIQNYIYNKIGTEIKFDNFYVSPFSITFINLKKENVFLVHKITFKINPLKLFKHVTRPLGIISNIYISNIEFYISNKEDYKFIVGNKSKFFAEMLKSKIFICIDKIKINNKRFNTDNSEFLKIENTNIVVSSNNITLNSIVYISSDVPIKLESNMERQTGNIFTTKSIFTAKNKINMFLRAVGTIDFSSLDIYQNITVEKLLYKGFKFDGLCSFSQVSGNCNIDFRGNFGNFKFIHLLNNDTKIESQVDISKLNSAFKGNLKLDFKCRNNNVNMRFDVTNLSFLNFKNLNFKIFGLKNDNNIYKMSCLYGLDRKMEIIYEKSGKYKIELLIKNKNIGVIEGNLKTGAVSTHLDNVSVSDIPFMRKGCKGIINIFGSINEFSGQIDFALKDFCMPNMRAINVIGSIMRTRDMYVLNFYKDDNSIALNTVIRSGKIALFDFKFIGLNITNIINICNNCESSISGTTSGRIKYEKNLELEFDIKAFDGELYDNEFKKIEIKGNINPCRINIERFVLVDKFNDIIANVVGLIGFTDKIPISSLYITLKNLKIAGVPINTNIVFEGHLDKKNEIKGVIRSAGTSIANVSLGDIIADAIVSIKKLKISNIRSNAGLNDSYLFMNFAGNKLSGNFNLKNINIQDIYPRVSGFLNSHIKLFGKLSSPNIKVSTVIKDGKCSYKTFSLSSLLEYDDNTIKVNKIVLISDRTKISLQGKHFDNCKTFFLMINNLNEEFVNMLIGFHLPFTGNFSGTGRLFMKKGEKKIKIFLKADTAYIENLKLYDIKSNIEIDNNNIVINDTSAKISNSEIKINKGFFNIKSKKYELNLFLINVHAGPIDIFGNINLSGEMIKQKGRFIYNGIVDFSNLWLNEYKLVSSLINYEINNKILKFCSNIDSTNKYNIKGLIMFKDIISIRGLNISKDKTLFDLNADFSEDFVNIGVKSLNIDWRFMTNIFNLPNILEGSVNIKANLSGKIDNPKGNISLFSTKGCLAQIHYDNFDIEVNLFNNRAYIKKASIFKKNTIHILFDGDFPFWFDKKLSPIMRKEPINIFYKFDDYKLNFLKYLSNGYILPSDGKAFLKGILSGNYEKLNNNASLSIIDGAFETKEYVSKIKNMCVEISMIEDLIKINKFNLKSGSGQLNVYGQMKLNNFSFKEIDINLVTDEKGIPLEVHQLPMSNFMGTKSFLKDYSFGEPRFDLKIKGSFLAPKISGRIILENTRFTFPGVNRYEKSFIPENTEFDLELATAYNTKFENSFVSAFINGSIRINGKYNNINVNGVIETTSGRFDYFGVGFDIVNAKLEIINDNQVFITAEGKTIISSKHGCESENIRLLINRVNIKDLSKKDAIKFTSKDNPNMNYHKVFEKIGTSQDNYFNSLRFEGDIDFIIGQKVLHLLEQTFVTPITRAVLRKIGLVDSFRISYVCTDEPVSNEQNSYFVHLLSGTKCSLEKKFTNQFLLGYSVIFDEFNKKLGLQHELEMKYKLTTNLFLSGVYGLSNNEKSYKPDRRIMLQHIFRFGPHTKKRYESN
ncbi:MAG: translocation/assembly module TamB domain-containing protein [Endomicrobium sp.]|jgi:hypothetical protein|nr:translocation/assembly module TamB domain-containing protein [Endomicrobium sp.]